MSVAAAAARLERELAWLDAVLAAAVARQRAEGRWRGDDDLRGVYTSAERAEAILNGRAAGAEAQRDDFEPLTDLARPFGLDDFERFALLLALAPEVDSRYRTVLGFLHDDVARVVPTVALALDLFAGAGLRSAHLRRAFAEGAPLVAYRLVRLRSPSASPSLLERALDVDEWVVARALGQAAADPRCESPAHPHDRHAARTPLAVVAADRRAAVDHALDLLGVRSLVLDLEPAEDADETVRVAARSARADRLGLVVAAERELADVTTALASFAADGMPVAVVVGRRAADALPDDWLPSALPGLTTRQRRERWELRLAAASIPAAEGAVDAVSAAYPIALDRIDAAVTRLSTAGHDDCSATDLHAAARAVARHQLGSLARRVPGGRSWDELVLPQRTVRQLHEISDAIAKRPVVLEQWGFGARPGGRGMHVLFSGPSGTGKTLAASVIADEAGYALFAVDLARVVDKYLGETEKQLDRVFDEASAAGAVLLFDEADALFGRRAEVHDARDRYANVEVAYLLQRLEGHEGVTILATNLPHHLDDAFARRLHHRVEFPMPDAALRRSLWRASLPPAAPLADDLDLDLVAERFELAGGSIRNAALTAAYLAAGDGGVIGMASVVRAVARELEKAGRPPTRAEFRELQPLLDAPLP